MPLKPEIERRQSNTDKILALLMSRPTEWIHWKDIERAAGGGPAWRTRISDARLRIKKHGDVIEWNKNVLDSSYRYLPWTPLGRAAETQILRSWTSDGPYTEEFRLKP